MILGLSYSIYSVVLFCTIADFAEESMLGKAYALNGVFVNLGRVIFAPIVGKMMESGFQHVETSFVGVSLIALCINIYISRNG